MDISSVFGAATHLLPVAGGGDDLGVADKSKASSFVGTKVP